MPVTLKKVIEHVAAMDPDLDPRRVSAIVRETLGAVGLLVNASNDEVYSPAPAPSSYPQQRNVRYAGMRRR